MARYIKSKTVEEAYFKAVNHVMSKGEMITDERGSRILEVLNLVIEVSEPKNHSRTVNSFWNGEKLGKYEKEFLDSDKHGFVYTYGNRLRGHFIGGIDITKKDPPIFLESKKEYLNPFISETKKKYIPESLGEITRIDQIQEVIKRLKNCRESRRATAVTWDPTIDTLEEDVPCMILVDFKIRKNLLNVTGVWRSHDIYGAWYPNLKGLIHLAEYVASGVDVELGTVTTQSISAHVYEVNWKEAMKLEVV